MRVARTEPHRERGETVELFEAVQEFFEQAAGRT
jgi:hypothetical protein